MTILFLAGRLWQAVCLQDVNMPGAGNGSAAPTVRPTRAPAPGPTLEAPQAPGPTAEAPQVDTDLPTDVSDVAPPAARDVRVPAGKDKVDVSVLTTPDGGDPFPDVTGLIQAGKLDKAAGVLRQALTNATPRQQYHLYFMLSDIALAAGDVKALNDAYDHVLKVADADEADPIETLRSKDLAELAARQGTAPAATDTPAPTAPATKVATAEPQPPAVPAVKPAADPVPASEPQAKGSVGQAYLLENRVKEHKAEVEEHANHILNLARLAQSITNPDEMTAVSAQAASTYEHALGAYQQARSGVETLQAMAADHPESQSVQQSLARSQQTLGDAEQLRQAAEQALTDMAQSMTQLQAGTRPAPTAPVPATPPQVDQPVHHTTPSHPAHPHKPKPVHPHPYSDRPVSPTAPATPPAAAKTDPSAPLPIPTLTTGTPTEEEMAWSDVTYKRFLAKDPTLTKDEKLAYNDIAKRFNKSPDANAPAADKVAPAAAPPVQTAPPATTPAAPEKPHSANRFLNWLKHPTLHPGATTDKPAPAAPGAKVTVAPTAPTFAAPAPVAPQASGPVQAAAADHEHAYQALEPRSTELQQRRWAISKREMAVTALGITKQRADEILRQRALLEQDRAKLQTEATAADQAFFEKLLALQAVQQANDMDQFVTAKARKIRNTIFGQ